MQSPRFARDPNPDAVREELEEQEQEDRQAVERDLGGQYQIVRRLGRGAFGAVYLAREGAREELWGTPQFMAAPMTVVGGLANGRYQTLDESECAFGYVPLAQRSRNPVLYVRTRGTGDPATAAALGAARAELAALAPDLALHRPAMAARDLDLWRTPQGGWSRASCTA